MALVLANIFGWIKAHWHPIVLCLAGLVLLGAVLFFFDFCGSWWGDRKNDQLKANVNAILGNIENRNAVIANLKEQQAVEAEQLKQAAGDHLEAQGATNAAREETNKAIDKMKQAANVNGNVSVDQFREALRGL